MMDDDDDENNVGDDDNMAQRKVRLWNLEYFTKGSQVALMILGIEMSSTRCTCTRNVHVSRGRAGASV